MRVELGIQRGTRTKDAKLALVRKASTAATSRHGIGGRLKTRGGPKPVSLAKVTMRDAGES